MAGYEPIETASIDNSGLCRPSDCSPRFHAYANIDHYTRAFDAAGVHPDDVTSLDDLARLPFLVKDDLREAYPFGMFAVPREDLVRVHASSGTTGKPTVVGYTAADIDTWATVMARSLFAAGADLATCSTTPTAMACSRVASVPTTAARSWGAPLCPSRWPDRASDPAHHRLRTPPDHGHTVVLSQPHRGDGAPRH